MTTVTLRPDGAIGSGGTVTPTGAATAWQCTSDNSDSSYVAEAIFGYFVATLGTVSLPAGAVTKTLTPRVRFAATTGPTYVDVYVRDSTFATTYADTGVLTSNTTTPATQSGPASAVTLTQSVIDGLVIYAATTGAGVASRIHELYLDLVYATVPTTAVALPTGVQGTPTPTVAWSYNAGSDGDVQSRYQVRVFTAAQYGIGGFDPGTSPATWDSTVVLGAATSTVTGVLPNSSTLRAYVNVAQTINGTPQWSGWQFGGFTTSFTTSDIASMTGVDNFNGGVTLTVTRNIGTPLWTSIDVQHSLDAGTTWSYVRGATAFPAPAGATQTFIDYEGSNGATVYYRVRASYVSSGVTITGVWFGPGMVGWVDARGPWLKDLNNPSLNRLVILRQWADPDHDIQQGILEVLGSANPTVISDVRQGGVGQYVFQTRTAAAAADMKALLNRPFLLLQFPPTWDYKQDQYIALGKWTELHLVQKVRAYRHWAVNYVEIDRPPT